MPETTLTPSKLPKNHPALTSTGKFTAQAKRILSRKSFKSRYHAKYVNGETLKLSDNPVRNTALFYRIAKMQETFPESHNQKNWGQAKPEAPCGTAFCIAGHAVHETGWNAAAEGDLYSPSWMRSPWREVVRPKGTEVFNILDAAKLELGLTLPEQYVLFSEHWEPKEGYTVASALRAIGDGAQIQDVTHDGVVGLSNKAGLEKDYAKRGKIRTTGKKDDL